MVNRKRIASVVEQLQENPYLLTGDGIGAPFGTADRLAEKIGIDPEVLQYTIDEYNEMCDNGLDTKFHKQRKFLHKISNRLFPMFCFSIRFHPSQFIF